MDIVECVAEVARDPFAELSRVIVLHEVLVLCKALLELTRKLGLDVARDFVAVDTVPIAHHEQVEALLAAHVRSERVGVLIDLVRVTGLVTTRCGESEFCDGIETLVGI